eukprot:Nitzschia sp. Nitz4//scaffold520_size5762//355//3675//NITZ4_009204-RA/size5762-augustus-gene-0.3-mRNA-1//-1//CDS//3329553932//4954//frame0
MTTDMNPDNPKKSHCWLASGSADSLAEVSAICLGTGRFLRSVLVPALVEGSHGKSSVALIQTRGRSMMEYMELRQETLQSTSYEVDTVLQDGAVETSLVPCQAVFSLGGQADKSALLDALSYIKNGVSVLGVGVTEAGLAGKETKAMKDMFELLCCMHSLEQNGDWVPRLRAGSKQKICIIDMDNVPNNGQRLHGFMTQLAEESGRGTMLQFLKERVVFCDTMVDRITSQRPDSNGMVPRCEPIPAKALVICDPHGDLPEMLTTLAEKKSHGIVVRSSLDVLQMDISLKLRIANGTHTAIAHTLALLGLLSTDVLCKEQHVVMMRYLDALVDHQVIEACEGVPGMTEMAKEAWGDWRQRLIHPHFGLSSFFITQSGTAKGGIRWGPTVLDLVKRKPPGTANFQLSVAFAYAALLRWLTPLSVQPSVKPGVYIGWLDHQDPSAVSTPLQLDDAVLYADGMQHNIEHGWYEFKCSIPELASELQKCHGAQPSACEGAVRLYMINPLGGDLATIAGTPELEELVQATAVLYARLVSGDSLEALLCELDGGVYGATFATPCQAIKEMQVARNQPLPYRRQTIPEDSCLMKCEVDQVSIKPVVSAEVQGTIAIDLHTHLLPPSHGALCLWGIDELLTYHYLVAEYFVTAPVSVTPESFYALPKQEQANLIWRALFIDRTPVSEACRGVLTTLRQMGMEKEMVARNLEGIRDKYREYRAMGIEGSESFCQRVFDIAGLEYAIMTNIPFESKEAQYWKPKKVQYSSSYRSALRVDPLLAGDRAIIESALLASGYETTLEGARQYLRDWCDTMKPEYMMASTPHDFVLREGELEVVNLSKRGVNPEAMHEPGAFAQLLSADPNATCGGTDGGGEEHSPSVINENSDFLSEVLMKVCEERDMPVALKIGAHRGVNPRLEAAGDGVVAFADAGMLARLCTRFPKVRFLATFLSRNNQHEACVLANKFRNLHLYGCWWYCNNPSIIKEITTMRVEMLGTAFTAQHSDARVIDQLVYKWSHSRGIIAEVLCEEFSKCVETGWKPTRHEIRRDIRRLFRGSYEEFMAKSLI